MAVNQVIDVGNEAGYENTVIVIRPKKSRNCFWPA